MWEYVAERLTPRTSDLEVRDTSLARRAVSLDKELYSTLSLFFPRCINGYRRHTPCDGLACRPGRAGGGGGGGSSNTPSHASCQGVWYRLWPFGPGAHLYVFTWSYFSSLSICCLTQGNTALVLTTAATYFSRA